MRRTKKVVLCLALFLATLAGGLTTSTAGATTTNKIGSIAEAGESVGVPRDSDSSALAYPPDCWPKYICIFTGANFDDPYFDVSCEGAAGDLFGLDGIRRSAMNRCANRSNKLYLNGSLVACMNPGGNRPSPGNFNQIFVVKRLGSFC